MSTHDRPKLSISLHGSDVTVESAVEAAGHVRDALHAVESHLTGKPAALDWRIGGVKRICDRCGIEAPSMLLPDDWRNVGGDDFCEECA